MKKIIVDTSELKHTSFYEKFIEKAQKGEQVGGSYIYRENVPEKIRTKGGQTIVTRYKYYYITDMLKDSADKLLKNIQKFFFKGKEEEVKKIDEAYTKENIKKDYGADKKTWFQHCMEYFSHKSIWDKRFADKEKAKKFEKPIKQEVAEKISTEGMETTAEKPAKIVKTEKKEKLWKPNPSLMRKVWSLYAGKEQKQEEKQIEVIKETVQKPISKDIPEQVDWYQVFAGSDNRFYPSGTQMKPYTEQKKIINGKKYSITKRASSKTDLGDIFEGLNDFVFNSEYLGAKATKNFMERLKEKGFYPQKQYTDEKGEIKYTLMIREGSKSGNVEFVPNKNYGVKEYNVITKDDNGNVLTTKTFNDIEDAQKYLFLERERVNSQSEGSNTDTKTSSEQWLMDNERIYLKQSETDPKTLQIWRKMTNSKNSVMLGNVSKVGDEVRFVTSSNFFDNWKETKENITNIYNSTFEQKNNSFSEMDEVQEYVNGEHGNKIAMLGNQNAKKYGFKESEIEPLKQLLNEYTIENGEEKEISLELYRDVRWQKPQKILQKYFAEKNNTKPSQVGFSDIQLALYEIFNEHQENLKNERTNDTRRYDGNNPRTQQTGLSNSNEPIFNGDNETIGNQDVFDTENGSNSNEYVFGSSESGERLGEREFEHIGRLGKAAAKKIRAKCREILAKPDNEITAEDKEILRNYEGAGGLNEGNQTDAAVLSEFYTPRDVIKKVWEIVDKYNPNKDKKVIEPSAGTGRFAEDRDEDFTLCELDETSARIAKLLHPQAEVKQGAFQKLFMQNNAVLKDYKGEKYDVAVGNPPYGEYTGRYKGMGEGSSHTRYEEYFIDRTLDTLKDDGIMAFVVPSGFLRNGKSKAKEIIASKGKLLEAWRLPKGTFSSTDVGTDIVVLRKEKGNVDDFCNNKYFTDNETHVIGTESNTGNWGSVVVNLPEGKTVTDAINMIDTQSVEVDKQIPLIAEKVKPKEIEVKTVNQNLLIGDEVETEKGKGKVTGFISKKGKTTRYIARVNGERVEIPLEVSEAEEHKNRSDAMKGNQNAKKAFTKQKETKAKKGDTYTPSEGHIMSSSEFSQKMGKDVKEEDIKFWKKTNWEGTIDQNDLTKEELAEIRANDNFIEEANGVFIPVATFASGNIYEKLDNLETNDPNYEYKKSLLEAALPEKKELKDVTLGVTANFAKSIFDDEGKSLVDKFLFDYIGFNRFGSQYGIKLSSNELEDNMSWQDVWDYVHQAPVKSERATARDPVEKQIQQEENKMIAEQKKQKRREVAERLFNEFVRSLPEEERNRITDLWNRRFNAFVNPDFNKVPLLVDGLCTHKGEKEFTPTDQQIKGITALCNKGNGILAYDVGVGKTFCGIVAAVNQLQTGKAKHPTIMVPKSVYKKWIKEIHQHFPDIPVTELGNFSEKDLKKYRDEEGNFNFPENCLKICTYEGLQKITFKDSSLDGELLDDMLDSQSIFDYDENGNLVADTRSEREKATAKEKIEKLLGKTAKAKEGAVYWEDLGIDNIVVDELHNFKNIFSIPRNIGKSSRFTNEKQKDYWGRPIKGKDDESRLSNEFQGLSGASSSRGMKMFAISQLIQRENNGRGFFGLSATPFNNSPIEIYNILSLCARNRLKDLGIYNMQDFLREFAELKPDWKVSASGNVEQSQTMKNFKNLSALQNLITEFIDKVDGEEAGVIRPRKQTHRPTLDLTPLQKQIIECEKLRMDGRFSKNNGGKPSGDVLIAMNNMRMATLSPSLVDPKFFADYEQVFPDIKRPKLDEIVTASPKLQFTCDSIVDQYKDRPSEGQVIYMPRGVEQYEFVRDYLVKKGMPKDSIAFMDSSTSLDKKEQIKEDFNNPDGKIKVIIGSETIKEGVSLNGNSTTLYNTFLGWNPTETIQVEGRIWRQGNKQGITHIVYPLMNDSIDSMMMQKYDEKSSRINAIWSYKGNSLNVEDYDPEEVKFALIKDPAKRADFQIKQKTAELKKEVRLLGLLYDKLYYAKRDYDNTQRRLQSSQADIGYYTERVEERKTAYENTKKEVDKAKKSLTAAKKSKDEDLITLAEKELKNAQEKLQDFKDNYDRAKSELRNEENYIKKQENELQSLELFFSKQGTSYENIDNKLSDLSQKRTNTETEIKNIEDKKKEYIQQAKEQIEKEEAQMSHDSVETVVNNVTSTIGKNLRIMDAKMKEEIGEELKQRFPHLRKSIPLFFVKDGRFYIRKM